MQFLVATGGSPHSTQALHQALYLASLAGASLTVLTVIHHERDRPHAESILQQALAVVQAQGLDARPVMRVGQIDHEILHEAEAGDFDLLIIGERGAHSMRTRLATPVSERLARRTPDPMLVVRGAVRPWRKVLFCTGFETEPSLSDRFLATGLDGLLEEGAETVILHVMSQISAFPGVRGAQLRADAEELIRERAPEGELLQQDVQVLEIHGGHPRPKVRHGFVVDEILEEARGGDYDLVVIGAHRSKGWTSFLLDDITREILSHIDDRSLLIVPI